MKNREVSTEDFVMRKYQHLGVVKCATPGHGLSRHGETMMTVARRGSKVWL